jgi:heat shock protein HslJ
MFGKSLLLLLAMSAPLAPALAASSSTVTVTVQAKGEPMSWTGTWSRLEIADAAGALQAAPEPAKVIFEVDPQLFVSMSVGCNRIGSQLLPGEGDAVAFAPGMATRMACMGPVGEAEQRLLDAITRVARYEKRGDDVAFLDADGHPLLLIGR